MDSAGARLQGQTVAVSARSCRLADVYADRVRLEARSGHLAVGTLHADATVTAAGEGRIVIGQWPDGWASDSEGIHYKFSDSSTLSYCLLEVLIVVFQTPYCRRFIHQRQTWAAP